MARQTLDDNLAQGVRQQSRTFFGYGQIVPPDNYPITVNHPTYMQMNPGAAVDVLLPTSGPTTKGMIFIFKNIHATNVITLKTDGDAAFTTAITVAAAGGVTRVICTGNTSQVLGWEAW